MSAPLHNIHPVTRLPPAPPGYVSCTGHQYYDGKFQSEEAQSRRKDQHFWLVAWGPWPLHGAFTYPVTGTQTHPPAPKSTLLLGPNAPSTLSNKRVLLYGLSCTHHLICPAPTLLLPPGALHRQMRTHCHLAAQGILGLVAVTAPPPCLSPSPGRPPFLSPLSSSTLLLSTSQLGHTNAIPISLSPPFNGPQGAPMWMRTSFPRSKRAHCKEVERRACASAKHEARASAAPPHHITSVEIMCAPSPGVTIGLVPKPEPESDTEPNTVIERQAMGTASSKTPGRRHSGPPGVWAMPEELASVW
ncbi:hypothetical protein C8F04DRAFT_1200785 [Mycena alexandri]|uniref:Uncharacterized protein n=1 Tax=Mycena alexandri TaxID=1745969 RepID=A0AAD6WLU8_9AGAR|nr:hypothetical protein C8F04DRAFT_1200785 [Mycena alexandri]